LTRISFFLMGTPHKLNAGDHTDEQDNRMIWQNLVA
jgi:hypothetical protein